MSGSDFLDEIIEESTKKNPEFPELVDAAYGRRRLLKELVRKRERANLTQQEVATKMGTSQSAVARLEGGGTDLRLSTVDRYATAVGHRMEWRLRRG